jgi:hypothetical protein
MRPTGLASGFYKDDVDYSLSATPDPGDGDVDRAIGSVLIPSPLY